MEKGFSGLLNLDIRFMSILDAAPDVFGCAGCDVVFCVFFVLLIRRWLFQCRYHSISEMIENLNRDLMSISCLISLCMFCLNRLCLP